ncbi:MAG: UDP-N-acetylglucosamine 2-epimerase (non-hydrolyzing) [Crocinitomicaceae bacterium]
MKKKIITIVGARPQIIKSSAISRAISGVFKNDLEEIIVHTGQHYDENMSKVFFEEMMIPVPNYNLNVGSGSHGVQTAKMLEGLEDIFIKEQPNAVLVYGDTNSTIAGALSASKIHIPVIHVEAGLRSFNKAMPEEINRISCDHMSTMLFTPTQSGIDNLIKEGFKIGVSEKASIDHPHVYHCGDIMFDNSLFFSKTSEDKSTIISNLNLEINGFVLCTVHRDSNTDIKENMESIFQALLDIAENSGLKVILPLHPRTKAKMETQLSEDLFSAINESEMIKVIPPAGFLDIIALEKNARIIVTDSGGLQKESFFFQKPCVILRAQTEWIEIVENGNAILADCDYNRIINAFNSLLTREEFTYPILYGDGKAADFICKKIVTQL